MLETYLFIFIYYYYNLHIIFIYLFRNKHMIYFNKTNKFSWFKTIKISWQWSETKKYTKFYKNHQLLDIKHTVLLTDTGMQSFKLKLKHFWNCVYLNLFSDTDASRIQQNSYYSLVLLHMNMCTHRNMFNIIKLIIFTATCISLYGYNYFIRKLLWN